MDVFLRQAGSIVLVFSLLGAMLWALKRTSSLAGLARKRVLGTTRSMIAVERLVLTPQHTLHRILVNGREILVSTHPQGCTVVNEPIAPERSMAAKA